MAEQKKKSKRTIKYGDNEYSYDLLQKAVLDKYNSYASKFGYSKTKFMKDYQALTEMLRQIGIDEGVTFEPGRINFTGDFANEKGLFGKSRNKSKHYSHPAWMIIDTLQGMDPYEDEDNKKKKITVSKILSDFRDILQTSNINDIPESERDKVLLRALNMLLNIYGDFNNPNYEFEGNLGADYFNNMFADAVAALNTTNNKNDDKYYLYKLFGLTGPTETSTDDSTLNGKKKEYVDTVMSTFGLSLSEALEQWRLNLSKLLDDFNKKFFGLESESTSKTSSSKKDDDTTGSVGVVAGNASEKKESPKTDKEELVEEELTNKEEEVKSGNEEEVVKPGNEGNPEKPPKTPPKKSPTYSTFSEWEKAFLLADQNGKRKLMLYLIDNANDIKGYPTSRARSVNQTTGIYLDKTYNVLRTNKGKEIVQLKRDGGYLKLLKLYKNA